jgi:16S rRNA (guanine966-N2)-methyltransferase
MRQALFNVLRHHGCFLQVATSPRVNARANAPEGEIIFADLFAGSGAVGIEAASQGATSVFFVESHGLALDCLKENMARAKMAFQKQHVTMAFSVAPCTVAEAYGRLPLCNIIFSDPPYGKGYAKEVLSLEAMHSRIKHDGILVIEENDPEFVLASLDRELRQASLRVLDQKNYGDSTLFFFVKTSGETSQKE